MGWLALCMTLAAVQEPAVEAVPLSPYTQARTQGEPEESKAKKKEKQERPDDEGGGGGVFSLPDLVYFGPTFYPSVRFPSSDVGSRVGFGLDALFGITHSFLLPVHIHAGVTWVEDRGDFDLTIIKFGAGIHLSLGSVASFNASVGPAYLMGDVDGTRFAPYVEFQFSVRHLFFANSYFGVGYMTVFNIDADLETDDIKRIDGIMAVVGVYP